MRYYLYGVEAAAPRTRKRPAIPRDTWFTVICLNYNRRRTVVVGGFGLYAVGFLGVAHAGTVPFLIGALLVFGTGNGLVTPTLFASISALAPDGVRAGVMSLQTTTIGVSQAVGPALFTLFGDFVGYQGALLGGSFGAALGAGVLGVVTLE